MVLSGVGLTKACPISGAGPRRLAERLSIDSVARWAVLHIRENSACDVVTCCGFPQVVWRLPPGGGERDVPPGANAP